MEDGLRLLRVYPNPYNRVLGFLKCVNLDQIIYRLSWTGLWKIFTWLHVDNEETKLSSKITSDLEPNS